MNSSNIKISIVFPSYNGEKVIGKNLESIQNLSDIDEIELIIIDNNSTDSTVAIIKSFKNNNINLIELKENVGFAKACNIGAQKAQGDFLFITNQDVAFPKDFFKILLILYAKLGSKRDIIISPAIVFPGRYINYYGAKIHFLGFSYTPEMYQKIPQKKTTFKTQKASGCSMFMKRKIFLELNGFDSYFFMYHEDTDFSLKAFRNNIPIYTTNETVLKHQKLHMMIQTNFIYYYIERNRYLHLYKNIEKFKNLIPYLIISELMLLFQAILTKKLKQRFRIYKFLIQNSKNIQFLRTNNINSRSQKIKKNQLSVNLDPVILGKSRKVILLNYLLKLVNKIL